MTWWLLGLALAGPSGMAWVGGGTYEPLYPPDPDDPAVTVPGFWLDVHPVTKAEFAAFVREQPRWQRGSVKPIFADPGYLSTWADPTTPDGSPRQPVVQVSWFAARAYCDARGKRLPTEDEWEIAASADATRAFARNDPAWVKQLLDWYGDANRSLGDVGQDTPNYWGVHDLHGLVWEWVEDFNNTVYGTDSREGGDKDLVRFCGAGALTAADAADYANFMRVAFRTSLQAHYTTRNLGFRCASDGEAP